MRTTLPTLHSIVLVVISTHFVWVHAWPTQHQEGFNSRKTYSSQPSRNTPTLNLGSSAYSSSRRLSWLKRFLDATAFNHYQHNQRSMTMKTTVSPSVTTVSRRGLFKGRFNQFFTHTNINSKWAFIHSSPEQGTKRPDMSQKSTPSSSTHFYNHKNHSTSKSSEVLHTIHPTSTSSTTNALPISSETPRTLHESSSSTTEENMEHTYQSGSLSLTMSTVPAQSNHTQLPRNSSSSSTINRADRPSSISSREFPKYHFNTVSSSNRNPTPNQTKAPRKDANISTTVTTPSTRAFSEHTYLRYFIRKHYKTTIPPHKQIPQTTQGRNHTLSNYSKGVSNASSSFTSNEDTRTKTSIRNDSTIMSPQTTESTSGWNSNSSASPGRLVEGPAVGGHKYRCSHSRCSRNTATRRRKSQPSGTQNPTLSSRVSTQSHQQWSSAARLSRDLTPQGLMCYGDATKMNVLEIACPSSRSKRSALDNAVLEQLLRSYGGTINTEMMPTISPHGNEVKQKYRQSITHLTHLAEEHVDLNTKIRSHIRDILRLPESRDVISLTDFISATVKRDGRCAFPNLTVCAMPDSDIRVIKSLYDEVEDLIFHRLQLIPRPDMDDLFRTLQLCKNSTQNLVKSIRILSSIMTNFSTVVKDMREEVASTSFTATNGTSGDIDSHRNLVTAVLQSVEEKSVILADIIRMTGQSIDELVRSTNSTTTAEGIYKESKPTFSSRNRRDTSSQSLCKARGSSVDDSDYLRLCATCLVQTDLGDSYFPRYFTEKTCTSSDSSSREVSKGCLNENTAVNPIAGGRCQQQTTEALVLKKDPNRCMKVFSYGKEIITDLWKLTQVRLNIGCECEVYKNSKFAYLVSFP